ncbi:hypothetical protein V1525DRAFT_423841 [Lipomyces kononenkoae]|uniref:Uncharacterized protein n=1 Tax=Lipomyces kononenkoae TaxID=34357 RepID=A0ACC3T8K7_LIPKO
MVVPSCVFTALPDEILIQIFTELDQSCCKRDLQSLAFTCKRVHAIGQQFMISDVTVSWHLLDVFHAKVQTSLYPLIPYITSFTIQIPSSWGEWHRSDILQDILDKCFNICFLQLTLSGSSKWLQYLAPNTYIRKLKLTSSQASSRIALFDVADLHAFKSVEELHLDYFRLQCEYPIEERAMPLLNTVKVLEILNCEWDYPFNMSLFRKLNVLNVYYTIKSEAFTFSERLKNLAANPPTTIQRLILHLDLFSPVRQKTWYPSLRACNDLELVSLKGFRRPPVEFFEALPDSLKEIELYFASKSFLDNPYLVASYDNAGVPIIRKYGNKTIRLIRR